MRILILANFGMGLYKFRKELLEELISNKNEIYISLPKDEYVPKLESIGCKFVETDLDRLGTNPLRDLKLFIKYLKILRNIKPDVVFTYTIKPNIYGGLACRLNKTPYITNITGLGNAVVNKSLIQMFTLKLYKLGLKNASCVFFQNKTNKRFFTNKGIVDKKGKLIPGSGVNLKHYKLKEYPPEDKKIYFLFIGRIKKAKGIEELLEAAKKVQDLYPCTHFDLIGGMEEDYSQILNELNNTGLIKYHGQQNDVHSFIKNSHATILPSYHEGTANVLLESASSGRPILASRVPGCIETFDEAVSGLGFDAKSVDSLVEAIIKFIHLPYEKKRIMGLAGRRKMEKEFDRNIVIKSYIDELENI